MEVRYLKKFILFLFIVFLTACEVNEEQNAIPFKEESSLAVDTETSGEDSHEAINDEAIEMVEEETAANLFLDQYSIVDLLVERMADAAEEGYRDFRYLGERNYLIYFTNGHSIKVIMPPYIPDRVIHILEMMEMVGQALSKLPEFLLTEILEVRVSDSLNQPVLANGELRVGKGYLEATLFTDQIYYDLMTPVVTDHILSTTLGLSSPLFDELDNAISVRGSESSQFNIQEMYAVQLLLQSELVNELERQNVEEVFAEQLDFLMTNLSTLNLELLGWFKPLDVVELTLPDHQNPNIHMGIFYDLITPADSSSLIDFTYHERGIRYYEKMSLPEGCFHPFDCPETFSFDTSYPFEVHVFHAQYQNGQVIEFNMESSTSLEQASIWLEEFAMIYGRLPEILLRGLEAVLLVEGRGGVTGSAYHGWFTTLANCGDCNLFQFDRLEELILHELVHTTLDEGVIRPNHLDPSTTAASLGLVNATDWANQIALDGTFVSMYAEENQRTEDLAESMLLYAAIRYYPNRLHPITPDAIRRYMPNRVAYLDELFDQIESSHP
jgi:hypothetical protein